MIQLNQDQFQYSVQIQTILGGYVPHFRRKVSGEQIQSMSDRLALWGFKGAEVEQAVETLLNRDDEKFPTANEIRDISKGKKQAQSNSGRDPKTAQDFARFEENLGQLQSIIGKEGVDQYYEAWLKAFFAGENGLGIFKEIFNKKLFLQVAIADLMRAYGKPGEALKLVRAERERRPDYTTGDYYEDDKYICYRGKTVRETSFTIKEQV